MAIVETILADDSPFANSGAAAVETPHDAAVGGVSHPDGTAAPEILKREYCEFCNGYFILEYHFGRQEGGE